MSAWYCYRTHPGMEERAHNALIAAGVNSLFVHQRIERRRHRHSNASKKLIGRCPVLVGYVVVQFDHQIMFPSWDARIRRITCYGGPSRGHVPVVRGLVGQIVRGWRELDHLAALAEQQPAGPSRRVLAVGDAVRATAGPFADQTFSIEAVTRQGARVRLGAIPMTIPIEQLEAA